MTSMVAHRRTSAVLLALVVGATGAAQRADAADKTFPKDSLIIPAQIEYQSDTGVISAYGLVYAVLLANQTRSKPIPVYWVVQSKKKSHHRCRTYVDDLPTDQNGAIDPYANYNDDDGCDFWVSDLLNGAPVVEIDSQWKDAELDPWRLWYVKTSYNGQTAANAGQVCRKMQGAGACAVGLQDAEKIQITSARKRVKYSGGAWVIHATDVPEFLKLLQNSSDLRFWQYHGAGPAVPTYVRMHRTKVPIEAAPVARTLTTKPRPIALVDEGGQAGFLKGYLDQAGLTATVFANRQGPGNPNENIFDLVTNDSLTATGGVNALTDPGDPFSKYYRLLWMIEWSNNDVTPARVNAVAQFAATGGTVFAESNSILSLEAGAHFHTDTGTVDNAPAVQNGTIYDFADDCSDRSSTVSDFHSGQTGRCLSYQQPGLVAAQLGSFQYMRSQADVKAYMLSGTSHYGDGVTRIASICSNGPVASLSDCASASGAPSPGYQVAGVRHKDNDSELGEIVYLPDHRLDSSSDLWGVRIVLNTLLSVGSEVPLEIARSEPVGHVDSDRTVRVFQGTYEDAEPDPKIDTYTYTLPHAWRFPFVRGHLRAYTPSALSTTAQDFSAPTSLFDAAAASAMPKPWDRTIWTYVNGSGNLGWRRIDFKYDQAIAGCQLKTADGKCRLATAIASCSIPGLGEPAASGTDDNSKRIATFIQQVRGHCAPIVTSPPTYEPKSSSECMKVSARQPNIAKLGGIDHASAAVVGASPYLKSPSPYAKRPVVAYAGARDGMLHAFYVAGGAEFSADNVTFDAAKAVPGRELWAFVPPTQLCQLWNNSAAVDASLSVIDVLGDFPVDKNGDGVIDWTGQTGDQLPDGQREWRTVLIGTVGASGSEVFALDVTNPLTPVLLWDVRGSVDRNDKWDRILAATGRGDGTFSGDSDHMDKTLFSSYAIRWQDWDDDDPSTVHIPTAYGAMTSAALEASKTGRYDYSNLGASAGGTVGRIWNGTGFNYVTFLTSNHADYTKDSVVGADGRAGVEVFAIDVISGQKLWQWQHVYRRLSATSSTVAMANNDIPGRPAVLDVDVDGSVDRLYVGDMEGRLWELSASDGTNRNFLEVRKSGEKWMKSLPLFGSTAMATDDPNFTQSNGTTARQPLTTSIGVGRFSAAPSEKSHLIGRLSLAIGTMGVDWSVSSTETGHVFVIPAFQDVDLRVPSPVNLADYPDVEWAGVLKPGMAWDIALSAGERSFGTPRISNNRVVFNTAKGMLTGDISETLDDAGAARIVGPDDNTPTTLPSTKSIAGVLFIGNKMIVSTARSIMRVDDNPAAADGRNSAALQLFNRRTPATIRSFEPQISVEIVSGK